MALAGEKIYIYIYIYIYILWGNLAESEDLEDVSVNGRVIIK